MRDLNSKKEHPVRRYLNEIFPLSTGINKRKRGVGRKDVAAGFADERGFS
jgi:hypothetical protein